MMSGLRQAIRTSPPMRPLSPATGSSLPSPADLFNYFTKKPNPSLSSPTRAHSTKRAAKDTYVYDIPGSEDEHPIPRDEPSDPDADSTQQPWILDSATAYVPEHIRSISRTPSPETAHLDGPVKANSEREASSRPPPDFSSFSTAELREQMELCGLEKVVARVTMIKRLNKFWDAQLREFEEGALPELPTLLVPKTKAARKPRSEKNLSEHVEPPKKKKVEKSPPGSKEKSPKRRASRSPSRAKSPRRRSKSPPKTRRKVSKNAVTLADEQFDLITAAVRQAAKNPNDASSFYYKILMYDPIIHEELAEWLNERGLADIGVELDDTITVADAVKWCDLHSVCSLPKETQRGLERKRY